MPTIEDILEASPNPAPTGPEWERAAERAADAARAEALAHGDDPTAALVRARAAFEVAARGVQPLAMASAKPVALARWRLTLDGRLIARTMAPVQPGDRVALFTHDNRRDERVIAHIAPGPEGSIDCAVSPAPGESERAIALAERAAHERALAARATIGTNTRATVADGLRADADQATGGSWATRPDGQTPGEVCAAAAQRIRADREAAAAAGLLLPDPSYAIGSRLNGTGVARATAAEIEHEKRPLAIDALAALAATIRDERRRGEVVALSSLALGEDGYLRDRRGGFAARVEAGAWGSVASAAGIGDGARMLARGSDSLRARAWAELADPRGPDTKILLRDAGGHESVWGAVGARYPSADGDRAAEVLARALQAEGDHDARARIDYDGRGWRVEISRHTPIAPDAMAAGEVVRAAIVISSHDAGGGAMRVRPAVVQNACLNLILLDEVSGQGARLAHRGAVGRLLSDLREGILSARAAVAAFWERWREASRTSIPDPEGTIRAIVASGRVPLPGGRRGRPNLAQELIEAHEAGMGDATIASAAGPSRATIADAFTRWAHQKGSWSLSVAELDDIRSSAAGIAVGPKLPEPITREQLAAAP